MFKKFFITVFLLSGFIAPSFAEEIDGVKAFFESYVNAANSYSKNVINFYLPDAKIIRVVQKPDGGLESVNFPMDRYSKELTRGARLAKLSRYKNTYTNKTYKKLDNGDYKISAIRTPNRDKTGLPFYFIVTKTDNGWKVKEESMQTTVQKFLNSK